MADKKEDPFNPFTEETLRRAESMCADLALNLQVDRRGRSIQFSGAMSYLNDPVWEHYPITVVEFEDNPWLTLISGKPLDTGRRVLLVYRKSTTEDVKMVGKLSESERGRRGSEDEERYITRFDVLRDR